MRGLRSRMAVAEAMLELIREGELRPPLRLVAERAGVSLRLVHNHFADREQLFGAAAALQMEQVAKHVQAIDADGPLETRLDNFVKVRARLLEAITPVRRAGLGEEPFSASVRTSLSAIRDAKRKQVTAVFADELGRLSGRAAADLARSVCTIASWSTWEELRAHQSLTSSQARRVVKQTLRAVLLAARTD